MDPWTVPFTDALRDATYSGPEPGGPSGRTLVFSGRTRPLLGGGGRSWAAPGGITSAIRFPLFDRVHRLIMEVQPESRVVLSYKMPTYVAGTRQLHVGVWKHGLLFYGWEHGSDGGLVVRHPHLDNGKGTLRLPLAEAVHIGDEELRAFVARGSLRLKRIVIWAVAASTV